MQDEQSDGSSSGLNSQRDAGNRIMEVSPVGIAVVNRDGRFSFANAQAERVLGIAREQILQRSYNSPEWGITGYEGQELDREQLPFRRVMTTRARVENVRMAITWPDGQRRLLSLNAAPLLDGQGQVESVVISMEDVTERIQNTRQVEEKLRQAQKMEAIGQLAGGVAHDFNNILSATLMHLGLLRQNPRLTQGMKASLKELESDATRAANLTRQLLLFSRRQVARFEPVDVNALINNLLRMMRRLLGENITVNFEPAPTPVWVNADLGMLEQVIVNLSINSRDAMPKGGRLTISLEVFEFKHGNDFAKAHPDATPGMYVQLAVADTGCGMDESVLKRVFEPFFTTKEESHGLGLGLATVHGIVKQHGGWVEVRSLIGTGSSFFIYLPTFQPANNKAPAAGGASESSGGSETILLVEDETTLRRAAALSLRKLGYAVLEAGDATEAIKLWERHGPSIQLLLTDMVMPETITGLDLAERFKNERPALRIIITTGYSADLLNHPLGPDIAFLPKPYLPATLAKAVRNWIDAGPQL